MEYIGPDEMIGVFCSEDHCDGYSEFPYSMILEMYRDGTYIKLQDCSHCLYIDIEQLQRSKAQIKATMEHWRENPELMEKYRALRDVRLQGLWPD